LGILWHWDCFVLLDKPGVLAMTIQGSGKSEEDSDCNQIDNNPQCDIIVASSIMVKLLSIKEAKDE
jgi:hypothetical protein